MISTIAVEVNVQSTVVILAGIASGVYAIWLMIRQTRGSFREAVRDELNTHFDHVTKPAIDVIDVKVDKIQAQVELNDGKSLKDAVVRVEAKVDAVERALAVATSDRAHIAQVLEAKEHD